VDTLRYEKSAYAAPFLRQQLLDRRLARLVFTFAEVRVDHLSLAVSNATMRFAYTGYFPENVDLLRMRVP
jgi:hypothetical protein